MTNRYLLGVDGGGSKTIAWIAQVVEASSNASPISRPSIIVVGRGAAGPSNPRSVGFEVAYQNIESAIFIATTNAGQTKKPFDAACLSLAGVGRSAEQLEVRRWADRLQLASRTIVVDDIEPLHLAAKYEQISHDWQQCITLVVGTGSIACGRKGNESSMRLGGWGYLLGDEGSGYAIGLAALQSICRQFDDGATLSSFHTSLLHAAGLADPKELIGYLYQNPIPREQVAKLSRIVIENCSTDAEANSIINHAIAAMAQLIQRSAKRLGFASRDYALALSGGILSGNPSLVESLLVELRSLGCEPCLHHIIAEPIYGPLLMAKEVL
jgi:N-acetylglucosamine kinase